MEQPPSFAAQGEYGDTCHLLIFELFGAESSCMVR